MIDLKNLKTKKSVEELLEFGIINIDKPSGPTSFDISNFLKKTLGLRKTSHFGTLDPKVTGVLPIALNRACKLTGFFLGENKEYVGIMRVHKEVEIKKLQEIINKKFIGKIIQKPPVKSRVKRIEREREIISFEILEQNGKDLLFKTEVQGGTYIRKLIDDLGKELGIGAHMLELRRIRAGIFNEDDCVNLYDFERAVNEYKKGNKKFLHKIIIPGETILKLYPVINIKKEAAKRLFHGSPLFINDIPKRLSEFNKFNLGDKICVFINKKFIGVFEIINSDKIFAKPKFVLQPINKKVK
ncbi:MAG: RNA-guided pseudouridylation complex pseudouridine synthase subunit Cbf5 [Candidatus Pacearchaeota archaeon]